MRSDEYLLNKLENKDMKVEKYFNLTMKTINNDDLKREEQTNVVYTKIIQDIKKRSMHKHFYLFTYMIHSKNFHCIDILSVSCRYMCSKEVIQSVISKLKNDGFNIHILNLFFIKFLIISWKIK